MQCPRARSGVFQCPPALPPACRACGHPLPLPVGFDAQAGSSSSHWHLVGLGSQVHPFAMYPPNYPFQIDPLYYATWQNDAAEVTRLLAEGADPNATDEVEVSGLVSVQLAAACLLSWRRCRAARLLTSHDRPCARLASMTKTVPAAILRAWRLCMLRPLRAVFM